MSEPRQKTTPATQESPDQTFHHAGGRGRTDGTLEGRFFEPRLRLLTSSRSTPSTRLVPHWAADVRTLAASGSLLLLPGGRAVGRGDIPDERCRVAHPRDQRLAVGRESSRRNAPHTWLEPEPLALGGDVQDDDRGVRQPHQRFWILDADMVNANGRIAAANRRPSGEIASAPSIVRLDGKHARISV